MLFGETVTVYCENRTEHTDTHCGQSVPHKKHYFATGPHRLILFGETVTVYCENRTEHTDTLCGQSVPHKKHYSATGPHRLMLFGETVAVYCENRTEHTDTLCGLYLTGNTLRLRYRAQSVNVVWRNSRCLF
jgi:translation initiation factor IF-1